MFYTKNLPAWERITRVVAGIVMALCGFVGRDWPELRSAWWSRRPTGPRC